MQPKTRTIISLVPLAAQACGVQSVFVSVGFFHPVVVNFIKTHEGKIQVPGPTQLFVEHPGAIKLVAVMLFAVSLVTYFVTKRKMQNESDQLAAQGAVYGLVWYAGALYAFGVAMAAALPFFSFLAQNH